MQDERKGVAESSCRRKSSGILVAVSPCLQILSIAPMYSSESATQVVLLLLALLEVLPQLAFVVYDNACNIFRHVRKSLQTSRPVCQSAWQRLAALQWVLDRLHFTYHRACQDPDSSYFVPEVNPRMYPKLLGVDTEAAEQIFHIAERWQLILSTSSPVHQELLLLLFAHQHNQTHSCREALQKYVSAQAREDVRGVSAPCTHLQRAPVTADPDSMASCSAVSLPKKKKPKPVQSFCSSYSEAAQASGAAAAACPDPASPTNASLNPLFGLGLQYGVFNADTRTIHRVVLPNSAYAECGWGFQHRFPVQHAEALLQLEGFTCGTCFESREPFPPVPAGRSGAK